MELTQKHYLEFMGIDIGEFEKEKRTFKSEFRDLPLNEKYYYPLIETNYMKESVLSVSPTYYLEILDLGKKYLNNLDIINEFLNNHVEFRVRKMHRYVFEDKIKVLNISQPMSMDDVEKLDFGNDFDFEKYKKRKEKIFSEKRQFFVEENNKIASIGFISEVRCGGANIVVFTLDNYRGKGYGKEVVKGCINWCIERNILPIYLVEDTNTISKRIPNSLGFKKIAEEFIISE